MQTFPQAIQELENQLEQTEGTAQIPILKELINLYGKNWQYSIALELKKQLSILIKTESHKVDKKQQLEDLLAMAGMLVENRSFDEAAVYYQKAKVLTEKLQDPETWSSWHSSMLYFHIKKKDFQAVDYHFNQTINIFPKSNIMDSYGTYNMMGFFKGETGEYEKALEYYFQALKIVEQQPNITLTTKYYLCSTLSSIGEIYNHQNLSFDERPTERSQALEYFYKAQIIAEEIQSTSLLIGIYNNLGHINKANEWYDEALEFYQKSSALSHKMKHERSILACDIHIGKIYLLQKKYHLAIPIYKETLDIVLELEMIKGIVFCHQNLAKCYSAQGLIEEAITHLEQTLPFREKLKMNDFLEIYALLAELYEKKGDATQVLHYKNKQIELRNEMFTTEKEKSIVEMQTRYETEKKEEESKRLRELEKIKSRFFSQITHEFRTPLTLIAGPIQQILDLPKKNPPSFSKLQNQLSLVQRNTNRLSRLVNQLLDLSKLESGKMEVQKKHGNVIAFVQLIADAFQTLAKEKNIHLVFQTSMKSLEANFDEDKLEKILYNLLSNAFKFTPFNGKIKLQLQIQNKTSKKPLLQIQVQDTGRGIAGEQLAHIFDRFYQADDGKVQEAEGTGIGLSLVKELLELQGGKIEVVSTLGKGTIFTLQLPLEIPQSTAQDITQTLQLKGNYALEATAKAHSSKTSKTKKSKAKGQNKNVILVVEDNPDMQVYIQSILSPHYKILQAMDGEEGTKMALEHIPDLIVSDVMMPKKDGYMLCKELKTNEKTNHIPIVLLTAKAALSSRIEGLEQGADVYLSKPFSPKELLLNITNLIKVRQELQERYSKIIQLADNKETKESMKDAFLKKLIETIENHLDDFKLSAEKLSEYMYMSRTQIHRKLRALTNYSTTEFIRLIRLKKAKTMIENQVGTITEIAYDVGFSSPAYFTKCFTKEFGMSPSKWRNIE